MLNNNINLTGKTILVTGAAGFIGSNLCKRLLREVENVNVVGIDSITNDYGINYMSVSLDPKFEAPATFNPQSPDGITTPSLSPAAPTYYDLNGRRLTSPTTNGVTILRMQDGRTMKVVKK